MANGSAESQRWTGGGGYDWRGPSQPSAPSTPSASPGTFGSTVTIPGNVPRGTQSISGARLVRPGTSPLSQGIWTTRPSNASGAVYMGAVGATYGRFSPRPLVVDRSTADSYFTQLPNEIQVAFREANKTLGGRTGNALWTRLVDQAADQFNNYGKRVSPLDLFREQFPEYATSTGFFQTAPGEIPGLYTTGPVPDIVASGGSSGGYGGGYGGGGSTQTIDLFSPDSARGLLLRTMQSALGRDPSADEINAFTEALNEAQKASPVTVTSDGSTTTRSGGMEPDLFAADWVKAQDEYKSVQGNMYYDALISALTGG